MQQPINSFMRLGWCRSASRLPIAFVDLKAATLSAQARIYGKEAKPAMQTARPLPVFDKHGLPAPNWGGVRCNPFEEPVPVQNGLLQLSLGL